MNVYLETNFVLELALLQQQQESCERILKLCESGAAHLILPAYSFVEPYEALRRVAQGRRRLSSDLGKEVNQRLSRSTHYKEGVDAIQKVIGFLMECEQEEEERLRTALDRLLKVAEIIPLRSTILSSAPSYQLDHALSPQDSIVLASVLDHLNTSTASAKCFLNKDTDFGDPDIVDALATYGCKMLFSFDVGFNYITSQIRA